ncbi:Gfo/Idh/MocA family oxidoreductase [Parabacteroides sp. OttesenSCG-928-O15]|nr:Gfo/Idh/MocA family oxidoreductase [Parabacteroides sp. OttesenSCG-928-O15]
MNKREFLKRSALLTAGAFTAPTIVKASVFGPNAPSNRINIGVIGVGRQGRGDMMGVMRMADVRITAVCDLDRIRMADAKEFTETTTERFLQTPHKGVKMFEDYQELLLDKEIDGVLIATPDHQHARLAIDAAYAGKDMYLEKPASLTIWEGRQMSNAMNATGRIFQIGSQQRSNRHFRRACELVRSGRIGKLKTVEVRLPGDPPGGDPTQMPIPDYFNYDAWLGSTPYVPYTIDRVHPQAVNGKPVFSRPGWLRCEQFGAGMITGWGSHHFDIAHWAMDMEYSGPIEIEASTVFPAEGSGLWNVHGPYQSQMLYANGVVVKGMEEGPTKPNGILFIGEEGWIFTSRGGERVTDSDPIKVDSGGQEKGPLSASDPKILRELTDDDVHLYESENHTRNWIDCMRTRKPTIAPAEVAHRSCSACLLQQVAMHLKRKLYWDPRSERFRNDDEANAMISRPQRAPYQI